jgi:transcription antitermination factor NusG
MRGETLLLYNTTLTMTSSTELQMNDVRSRAASDQAGTWSGQSRVASTDQWYVAHCIPLKERLAARALQGRLDLMVFVPEVKRKHHGIAQRVLLFPGYIFVCAGLRPGLLGAINSMPGIVRLLAFGGEPRPVEGFIVEAIRERVDAMNAGSGLPAHSFRPGDLVQLNDGPLRGLEAVFMGPMTPVTAGDRVKVLLEFLGRPNEVQVDPRWLEHAPNATAIYPDEPGRQRPERRTRLTRGKGRRIRG